MGSKSSKENNRNLELKIGSLNYSGILKSPYQFYEKQEKSKEKLNVIFEAQIKKSNLDFSFKALDKEWQAKRYSPLYRQDCGIKYKVQMMSKSEFIIEWNKSRQAFEKIKVQQEMQKKAKGEKIKNPINSESWKKDMNNLLKFDLLIYKTLLLYVYADSESDMSEAEMLKNREDIEKQFQNLQTNVNKRMNDDLEQENFEDRFQLPAKKYRKHRQKMFSKTYLSEREKNKKVVFALEHYDLDVLFLQESTAEVTDYVEEKKNNYRIVRYIGSNSNTAAIFIKEREDFRIRSLLEDNELFKNNINELTSIGAIERKLTFQELQFLNFNEDTVIQAVGNLIFICPHLTSQKGEKDRKNNTKQLLQFLMGFIMIKQWFPYCSLIIGGDLNGSIIKILQTLSGNEQQSSIKSEHKISSKAKSREQLLRIVNQIKQQFLDSISKIHKENEQIRIKEWDDCVRILEGVKYSGDKQIEYCSFTFKKKYERMEERHLLQDFNIYITPKQTTTSFKKRTSMQTQQSKANTLSNQPKDYLISDLPLYDLKVIALDETIVTLVVNAESEDSSTPYLPTQKHPFDHFLVCGKVQVRMPLIRVNDPEYKEKYTPNKLTKEDIEKIEKYV